MRKLRFSALILLAMACSSGLTQTSSPQQGTSDQPQQKIRQHSSTDFDRGIRLKPASGEATCGSIVSYNFSQGEAPKLESVTTCTPSTTVVPRRARGKDRQPQAPQLQKTGFSPDK